MDEREYDEIAYYLSELKYPESIKSKDSRSNWRKKCRVFTYCKNALYYNHKKYGALLAVRGAKEKTKIIQSCHVRPDGKHHGINRTLKKVSTNYYWKTIAKDVHNFVKVACQSCVDQARQGTAPHDDTDGPLKIKPTNKIVDKAIEQIGLDVIGTILEPSAASPQESGCGIFKCEGSVAPNGVAQPAVLREHIMAQCGLDVLGPLTETHKGKRFVVLLTDSVTKWVEAVALPEFTTESIGIFLADTICRHGAIEEIVTKHNPEFCARLSEKVCSTIGVTVRMSTILPSQPNGYMEHYWYNPILCGALIKFSNQNQYYWDTLLNQVILAYRTFHQKSSSSSPFQLMYDRPLRLPLGITQPSTDAFPDEQESLLAYINSYLKVLSCSPHNPPSQNQDRLTPPYISSGNVESPATSTTAITSQQSTQILGSFAQTVVTNNPINTIPLSNLQSQNISVHTLPTQNLTTQLPTTNLTHNLKTQNLPTTNSHNLAGSHLITSSLANQVITSPHITVTQPTTVQTPTTVTTNSDSHAGHMVMIQTDGKTYADSYYLICPQ